MNEVNPFRLRHHAVLERIVLYGFRLTCRTGLHIGAGKSPELTGSDLPVLRDAAGRPLVPGSSLRGVLRSGVESVCQSLGFRPPPAPAGSSQGPLHALEIAWSRLDLVERLFGKVARDRDDWSYASRLQISDARCPSEVSVELRDGVAIERETRTARGGAKFDLEVVPAGTQFEGRLRFKNPAGYELGLLAQALWMLDAGLLLLGGKSARGLGWVEVQVSAPLELTADSLLKRPGTGGQEPDFGPVEKKLAAHLAHLADLGNPPGELEAAGGAQAG